MNRAPLFVVPFVAIVVAACSSGGPGELAGGDGGATDGGGRGDAASDASRDGGGGDASDAGNGGCHANADCRSGFEICVAPGQFVCGGAAPLHACNNDPDCADAGADRICVQDSCGGSQCTLKCTQDSQCGSPLDACDTTTGHCGPKACTPTSCPVNYTCSGAQGCVRTQCTTDAQCNGACVNGACWGGIGHCSTMPS